MRAPGSATPGVKRWLHTLSVRRDADLGDQVLVRSFRGGQRSGLLDWSSPLITLNIYESGLELRATFPWLMPARTWRVRYEDIGAAHRVGRSGPDSRLVMGLGRKGVMFTAWDGDWMIFWSLQRNAVLDTLASRGLTIQPKPKRLTLFGPAV